MSQPSVPSQAALATEQDPEKIGHALAGYWKRQGWTQDHEEMLMTSARSGEILNLGQWDLSEKERSEDVSTA